MKTRRNNNKSGVKTIVLYAATFITLHTHAHEKKYAGLAQYEQAVVRLPHHSEGHPSLLAAAHLVGVRVPVRV